MYATHDPKTVSALDELEAFVPHLIEKHTVSGELQDGAFSSEFAGIADVIVDSASASDHDYASGRVQCMLKNAGLIPREDEADACD